MPHHIRFERVSRFAASPRASSYAALALAVLCFSVPAASQAPVIPSGPWKDLFNKKDFTGWSQAGNPPWSISNGIIQAKGGSGKTFLIWNEPMKDFELQVRYRLSTAEANSGIMIRSRCMDKANTLPTCGGTYSLCGPQMDVALPYSGTLYEECVAPLKQTGPDIDNCRKGLKTGEWITTSARVDGAKIAVWLNGVFCLEYTFTDPEHLSGGIFALQNHPPYDLVEWDYVKIRRLNVPGCTNPKASNFNPEADKDDGSCVVPAPLAPKGSAAPFPVSIAGNTVSFDVPWPGKFSASLSDADGKAVGRLDGNGPLRNVRMILAAPGVHFLEVTAPGSRVRLRIDGVGMAH
jgi:hypothetical protein